MIMKSRSILITLVLVSFLGFNAMASKKDGKASNSSNQSSISGVVIDKSSNEKLAGVTIHLDATDQKIYSNAKGEFNLEGIEPGTYKVKINCISYKEQEVSVKITKAQNEKLKILLNPVMP
jgi:hypothetical protein